MIEFIFNQKNDNYFSIQIISKINMLERLFYYKYLNNNQKLLINVKCHREKEW